MFRQYFDIFPWADLPPSPEGFDFGCGSGRWALLVAPRVATLHLIDASPDALQVAKKNLSGAPNCQFHVATPDTIPLRDGSMDFGYCLGVLHHVPNTGAGLTSCVTKLKAGAPFLLYLYYALDNRPWWYRATWRASDALRRLVSRSPRWIRLAVTQTIAALAYWPLARLARLFEKMGARVRHFPLAAYRRVSFYTMRTDAYDRFATRLEKRFTRAEVEAMMREAGLERIRFSEAAPYWCAVGYKRAHA